jgi:hypothetical protein
MNRLRTVGTAILERHGFFSIDQIMGSTRIVRQYCRDILELFCREGIIKKIKKNRKEDAFGNLRYSMVYLLADRKKLTARIAPRRSKNTVQDRMWFIIWNKSRNNGSFNLHDLVLLAGAKRGMARWYLKELHRAGYITPSRKSGPGVEWKLAGKFGAERPYVERSGKRKRDIE